MRQKPRHRPLFNGSTPRSLSAVATALVVMVTGACASASSSTSTRPGSTEATSAASAEARRIPGKCRPDGPIADACVACQQGDGEACVEASVAFGRGELVERDPEAMKALEQRACELGSGRGCRYMGNNFMTRDATRKSLERGARYYARGCELEDVPSCVNLVLGSGERRGDAAAESQPQRVQTVAVMIETCERGSAAACVAAGFALDGGHSVAAEPARATDMFRRACDAERLAGCALLSDAYRYGVGVARDEARADALWSEACGEDAFKCAALDGIPRFTTPPRPIYDPDPPLDRLINIYARFGALKRTVETRYCFTERGAVADVVTVSSSGVDELDAVVRETIASWRFELPRRGGRPLPGVCTDHRFVFEPVRR